MSELMSDDDELVDETDETAEMSLDEIRAARLLQATDTFIEALQQSGRGERPR